MLAYGTHVYQQHCDSAVCELVDGSTCPKICADVSNSLDLDKGTCWMEFQNCSCICWFFFLLFPRCSPRIGECTGCATQLLNWWQARLHRLHVSIFKKRFSGTLVDDRYMIVRKLKCVHFLHTLAIECCTILIFQICPHLDVLQPRLSANILLKMVFVHHFLHPGTVHTRNTLCSRLENTDNDCEKDKIWEHGLLQDI